MEILAYTLWLTFYQPQPKEEFYIIPAPAEEVVNPLPPQSFSNQPVKPMPVATTNVIPQPKVKEEALTEEQYYQVRPEPTGCPNGDSIPVEACFK